MNGTRHGFGESHSTYGTYFGEFRDDKFHGNGSFTSSASNPQGNFTYTGEYHENKWHGQGNITHFKAGTDDVVLYHYSGGWQTMQKSGYGVYVRDSVHYTGEFKNDVFNGYGVAIVALPPMYGYEACFHTLAGSFLNGQKHGHVLFKVECQSASSGPSVMIDYYSGEWAHDKKHGYGELSTVRPESNTTYIGAFQNN